MSFISKAGSCVVDNASKAWSFVKSSPLLDTKNVTMLIAAVALFSVRSHIFNIASKALSFVVSKLPNPTLKNAAILMAVVALSYAAFKRFYRNKNSAIPLPL